METPTAPAAPVPPVVVQNQPIPPRFRAWVWWIVGVLVVGAAAAAYWVYPVPLPFSPDATPTPQGVSGDVQWQAWELFTGPMFLPSYEGCEQGKCEENYLIGQFVSGPYSGGKLYAVFPTDGMGPPRIPYLFVRSTLGTDTFLERDSTQFYSDPMTKLPFTVDRDYVIPELQIPSLLTSPDGKLVLERRSSGFFGPATRWDMLAKDTLPLVKVFTDPVWGDVFTDSVPTTPLPSPGPGVVRTGANGFYVRLPSGMAALYAERIDFMQGSVPSGVRWSLPGGYVGGEYIWTGYGGCGVSNMLEVVYPYQIDAATELKEIGRTPANDPVLTFIDTNHEYLRTIYDTMYYVMPPQQKLSYEQYVANTPVFFWRDPLGRLVRFQNKIFLPQAECGKPVIYLYPEQTADVTVQVEPVGGMTFSEPAYGDGWRVTAQPDGRLTDASGAQWPYLFWEGRGGLYEQPKKGWVVARADVERLLDEKLSAFGLVRNEIADFKEFWLPRMQDAPYYFVTFLGNQAMDELAPLSISPAPDTVIRVLMDFSPLSEPMQVEPYTIRTPARNGFTVVEWGGVLR